ncbi:hypothetical protein SAMN02745158_03101 [Lactonifactor longoviformis DSM 17459]|uniref:Uncharacterized protein n=4 Tax=Lactonifactor TaxID=420345 RepID=A0A1M5AA27_9CLOT|nr:hypothetical protein SAMN02745158_03101 [Lactonifactor longoviformis DSM 17459]
MFYKGWKRMEILIFIFVYVAGYYTIADTYVLFINQYPYDKCITINKMRFLLFPYSKRNTSKGIPREMAAACIIQNILLFCVLGIWLINMCVYKSHSYMIGLIYFISIGLFGFIIATAVNLEIFFDYYKRVNRDNIKYLFLACINSPRAFKIRKKLKSEVEVLEVTACGRKGSKAKIRVERSNDIIECILFLQKNGEPYYLYERCGVLWVEGKEPNYVFIEDLVEKMTIKRKYRKQEQFFIRVSDCKIIRCAREDIKSALASIFIEIPYINNSNYISTEDVCCLANYEECVFAEKWCRKRGIPYAYRQVSHHMVKF